MAYEIFLSSNYTSEINYKCWDDLPEEVQEDLATWCNLSDLDFTDKKLLFDIYMDGRFTAWDCPMCGTRILHGEPKDWSYFQGVAGDQDFASYPGNTDKYTSGYLAAMCDRCRLKE